MIATLIMNRTIRDTCEAPKSRCIRCAGTPPWHTGQNLYVRVRDITFEIFPVLKVSPNLHQDSP